jgi:hypothetical protein
MENFQLNKTFANISRNILHKFIFLQANKISEYFVKSKMKKKSFSFLKKILEMGRFNQHATNFGRIVGKKFSDLAAYSLSVCVCVCVCVCEVLLSSILSQGDCRRELVPLK